MSNKSSQSNKSWKLIKEYAPLFVALLAIAGIIVGTLLWVYMNLADRLVSLEDRLGSLESRLSNLEGQFEVLKSVVQYHAVTITTTSVSTMTALPSLGAPITGFPVESIIIGLMIGMLTIAYLHRRKAVP